MPERDGTVPKQPSRIAKHPKPHPWVAWRAHRERNELRTSRKTLIVAAITGTLVSGAVQRSAYADVAGFDPNVAPDGPGPAPLHRRPRRWALTQRRPRRRPRTPSTGRRHRWALTRTPSRRRRRTPRRPAPVGFDPNVPPPPPAPAPRLLPRRTASTGTQSLGVSLAETGDQHR